MIEADLFDEAALRADLERTLEPIVRHIEQAVTVSDVECVLCEDGRNIMVYITLSSGVVTGRCLPMPGPV